MKGWRYNGPLILAFSLLVVLIGRLMAADAQINWDEELYFLIARGWRQSLLPYSGIFDHKPPAVYLFYLLFSGWGRYFWLVRAATCAFLLAGSYVFADALRCVNARSIEVRLLLVAGMFAFFSYKDGLGANTELLYVPSLLMAAGLLLRGKPLGAAVFSAVAISIKYTCALDLLGLALFYRSLSKNGGEHGKDMVRWILWSALLTAASYLSFYIYFNAHGIDLLNEIFLKNIEHGFFDREPLIALNGLYRALCIYIPLYCAALWLNLRARTGRAVLSAITAWFVLSIVQGLLTGRYYYHYFIPAFIPLAASLSFVRPKDPFFSFAMLLVAVLSLSVFSRALDVRLEHRELTALFSPHCLKIARGAYVMDPFTAAYRTCNAGQVDRFVFPPFYLNLHFAGVSNSGGMPALREKVEKGRIPYVIVGPEPKYRAPIMENHFANVIALGDPIQSPLKIYKDGRNSSGFLKLVNEALGKYFAGISDLFASGLVVPPRKGLAILDTACIVGGLFVCFACAAAFFIALRSGDIAAPCAAFPAVRAGLIMALFAAAMLFGLGFAVERGMGDERMSVLRAMENRPFDPWPRGTGHVPLGTLGASENDKGYLEPGGSFSPWVESFGVSIWIVDDRGELVATSDDLDIGSTRHSYMKTDPNRPGLVVGTRYYTLCWQVLAKNRRALSLEGSPPSGMHLQIALRGVGPAGGPLSSVRTNGRSLILNDRWVLEPNTPLDIAYIGEEGAAGWTGTGGSGRAASVLSRSGWAHVRMRVPEKNKFVMTVTDLERSSDSPREPLPRPPVLDGIDRRFSDCLLSQIETLKQGIVGNEMRPGDPVNYPLAWLRDNAFQLAALARAGETALARRLSAGLATSDYSGGFGAEADNPGLALWALEQVACVLNDPGFDRMIWPHVNRKAGIIIDMLDTEKDIRYPFRGPIVPRHRNRSDLCLVAGPAKNGLVDGRMDLQMPLFYTSATSYCGLVSAAELANRIERGDKASVWLTRARALKLAWQEAFRRAQPGYDNPRTAVFGLWPSEIASQKDFRDLLESRWSKDRDRFGGYRKRPLWTYFAVAEAHQWLRLGVPGRTWATLDRLWADQPVPGLYTLWEGNGEENEFRRWRKVRGWVNPPCVTPHYWSAAELLLLQLGMLAEVHGSQGGRELIIGGGVLPKWLEKPLNVQGVGTEIGFVSWKWDGCSLSVLLPEKSEEIRVKAGRSFPPKTGIKIFYSNNK